MARLASIGMLGALLVLSACGESSTGVIDGASGATAGGRGGSGGSENSVGGGGGGAGGQGTGGSGASNDGTGGTFKGGAGTAGNAAGGRAETGGRDAGGDAGAGGSPAGGSATGGVQTSGAAGQAEAGTTGDSYGYCDEAARPAASSDLCRTNADCGEIAGLYSCVAPGQSFDACGACQVPMRLCESDGDCSAGAVCIDFMPNCSCSGTASSECRAACTETSCPAGQGCAEDGRCEFLSCEDDGYGCPSDYRCAPAAEVTNANGCEPLPCTEGDYECPVNSRCSTASRFGGTDHGCRVLPCASDSDCDCGTCVNTLCASGPGTCHMRPS